MINLGTVYGSAEQAQELIVGYDTVYVHSDITKLTEDGSGNKVDDLYSYIEIQYSKDEYIAMLSEQNVAIQSQIEATQEALDFLLLAAE